MTGKEPNIEELHANIPSMGNEVEYMDEVGLRVADMDLNIHDMEFSDRDDDDDDSFERNMTNVGSASSSDSTDAVETSIRSRELDRLVEEQERSPRTSPVASDSDVIELSDGESNDSHARDSSDEEQDDEADEAEDPPRL